MVLKPDISSEIHALMTAPHMKGARVPFNVFVNEVARYRDTEQKILFEEIINALLRGVESGNTNLMDIVERVL